MKTPQMCSGRPRGSTDMQHAVFRTGHDLDLISNFQNDLLPRRVSTRENDAGNMNVVPLLSQKLLQKTFFSKNSYFRSFCSLEAKPLTLDQIGDMEAKER